MCKTEKENVESAMAKTAKAGKPRPFFLSSIENVAFFIP